MPCCHCWSWARPPPQSGPQSSHQEPCGWGGHQAPLKTAILGQQSKGPLRTNKWGPGPELRWYPPPLLYRYVQSLLDIMEFLDKDPEDHRTLSQ